MGFEKKVDFFEIIDYIKSNSYEITKLPKSQNYTLRFHNTFDNELIYIRYSEIERCFFKDTDFYSKFISQSKFDLSEFLNFCRRTSYTNLKLSISKEQRDYNTWVIDYIDKRVEYLE